jgi:hypothetical protein
MTCGECSPGVIEGYVSSAVIARPGEARPCAGGAAAVWVGGGCFSTPLSLPLLLPALCPSPLSGVGVACHVWPPYHPPSRTPSPGPWLCREPSFVWGRRPPCAWLAWRVCTVRQQRPHVLQGPWGPWGRVTGCVSGMCGWGGRLPPPLIPWAHPPCHGLCTPQPPARVCVWVRQVCARGMRLSHTLIPGAWLATLCGGIGVGWWWLGGGEVPVASALQLPCWSGPGGDGATHALIAPVRS